MATSVSLDDVIKITGLVAQVVLLVGIPVAGIVSFNRLRDALTALTEKVNGLSDGVEDNTKLAHSHDVKLETLVGAVGNIDRRLQEHAADDTRNFQALGTQIDGEKESRHILATSVTNRFMHQDGQINQVYRELGKVEGTLSRMPGPH